MALLHILLDVLLDESRSDLNIDLLLLGIPDDGLNPHILHFEVLGEDTPVLLAAVSLRGKARCGSEYLKESPGG